MFGWHGSDQPTQEQCASKPRLSKSFLTSFHEDWHYPIKAFTANMWAVAKGQRSLDSRRQPSQTRRRGKHWEERKEKRGKSGRSDCQFFLPHPKTVMSQPHITLSFPVLLLVILSSLSSKNGGNVQCWGIKTYLNYSQAAVLKKQIYNEAIQLEKYKIRWYNLFLQSAVIYPSQYKCGFKFGILNRLIHKM